MTLTLINHEKERLDIQYPYVDYTYWSGLPCDLCDNTICKILDKIIVEIDVRREYYGRKVIGTDWPKYWRKLSNYLYYLLKINNQLTYNKYVDKIISRHYNNIAYEQWIANYSNTEISTKRIRRKSKKKLRDIISTDMFTGNTVILTRSNNINKLNRTYAVPLEHMKYSFKKK